MERKKYFACADAPGQCKPSAWGRCTACGRMVCQHVAAAGLCPECFRPEAQMKRVGKTYAGRRMAVVWRTEYGAYRHQTSPGYYRKKDALEMARACRGLGFTYHLQERPRYVTWHDWYGRPCGYSIPDFFLWVEMDATTTPEDIMRVLKPAVTTARMLDLEPRLRKPRAEWTYEDHETYHRYMGTL